MTEPLTLAAIAGGAILVWVLYLYRKGRLKEDHALLWSAVSLGIIILSSWTDLLVAIDRIVGAQRVSDVVVAAFIGFLLVVCIYYSVKISSLTDQNRRIGQELALLKVTSNVELKARQMETRRDD